MKKKDIYSDLFGRVGKGRYRETGSARARSHSLRGALAKMRHRGRAGAAGLNLSKKEAKLIEDTISPYFKRLPTGKRLSYSEKRRLRADLYKLRKQRKISINDWKDAKEIVKAITEAGTNKVKKSSSKKPNDSEPVSRTTFEIRQQKEKEKKLRAEMVKRVYGPEARDDENRDLATLEGQQSGDEEPLVRGRINPIVLHNIDPIITQVNKNNENDSAEIISDPKPIGRKNKPKVSSSILIPESEPVSYEEPDDMDI
ncbi:hypothetical protein CL634_11010 [bacterium]|nr:hypothetical protein [bacterium]